MAKEPMKDLWVKNLRKNGGRGAAERYLDACENPSETANCPWCGFGFEADMLSAHREKCRDAPPPPSPPPSKPAKNTEERTESGNGNKRAPAREESVPLTFEEYWNRIEDGETRCPDCREWVIMSKRNVRYLGNAAGPFAKRKLMLCGVCDKRDELRLEDERLEKEAAERLIESAPIYPSALKDCDYEWSADTVGKCEKGHVLPEGEETDHIGLGIAQDCPECDGIVCMECQKVFLYGMRLATVPYGTLWGNWNHHRFYTMERLKALEDSATFEAVGAVAAD